MNSFFQYYLMMNQQLMKQEWNEDVPEAHSRVSHKKAEKNRPLCRDDPKCVNEDPLHYKEYAHPSVDGGRTVCQYDPKCYQKNPDHFKKFAHPSLEGGNEVCKWDIKCHSKDHDHFRKYAHPMKNISEANEAKLVQIFSSGNRALIPKDVKLGVLLTEDPRYKLVQNYYQFTGGKGTITHILTVDMPGESAAFAPHANSTPRYLMWHGTPEAYIIPILTKGLLCNCQGKCFFAASADTSNGYAQKGGTQNQYYMFMAEVYNPDNITGSVIQTVSSGLFIPNAQAYEYTVSVAAHIHVRNLLIYTMP